MNPRFVPGDGSESALQVPQAQAALVTASYAPDFERCRLLCETADMYVTGAAHHYILVDHRDVKLFRRLETARRTVVDERDLLPSWLHAVDDPLSLFRRRVWLSFRLAPLRGWHVQQLRRLAIASHAAEHTLVYCDSDVAFLKPFDFGAFRVDGRTGLFRRDDALRGEGQKKHRIWSRNAGMALGIAEPAFSPHDYIATLIAWDRATVLAMFDHIERTTGRPWIRAVAADRRFSECMLYGRYVDEVIGGAGHFHGVPEFCRVHWSGEAMSDAALEAFVDGMAPEQVAIGLQSFIGTDIDRIRRLVTRR